MFHKNAKVLLAILGILLIGIAFLATAYVNGKSVIKEDVSISWVSHTEYWREDYGSTIVRLSDYKGNPYPIDECKVTILYPDKTTFVENQPMVQSGIPGNWYRTDYLGNAPLGTYEQEVTCSRGATIVKSSQSFHLNPALEQVSVLTEKSDNMDLKLTDVNVSVTGQLASTGEAITTNITTMSTSLNELLNDVNGSLSSQLQEGVSTLNTNLTNVNVSVTGTITTTGQEIKTTLTNLNTNLSGLLTNVNNGLLDQLGEDFNTLNSNLNNVNLSLSGTVLSTGEAINANISSSNTSLTNLINSVNVSLASEITGQFNNTNALIAQKFMDSNEFLSARLDNLQINVNGNLESTGQTIQTQITDVNDSLSSLINNLVIGNINVQINQLLEELTLQINSVKEDTNWLVLNAVNQEDMNEIRNRFISVDNNLSLVENFCGSADTNNSPLCQEVHNIRTAINIMDSTQAQKLEELNQTTTNTWNLLSGDITTKIDSLLTDIGIIKAQTTDINSTVHQILENQESEINIRIIS